MEVKPCINTLFPVEILSQFFSHLDMRSLCQAEQVCKLWHDYANSDPIWHEVLLRENGDTENLNSLPWKKIVEMRHRVLRNISTEKAAEKDFFVEHQVLGNGKVVQDNVFYPGPAAFSIFDINTNEETIVKAIPASAFKDFPKDQFDEYPLKKSNVQTIHYAIKDHYLICSQYDSERRLSLWDLQTKECIFARDYDSIWTFVTISEGHLFIGMRPESSEEYELHILNLKGKIYLDPLKFRIPRFRMFLVEEEHFVYVSEKNSTDDEVVLGNWKTQASTPIEEWNGVVHSCIILGQTKSKLVLHKAKDLEQPQLWPLQIFDLKTGRKVGEMEVHHSWQRVKNGNFIVLRESLESNLFSIYNVNNCTIERKLSLPTDIKKSKLSFQAISENRFFITLKNEQSTDLWISDQKLESLVGPFQFPGESEIDRVLIDEAYHFCCVFYFPLTSQLDFENKNIQLVFYDLTNGKKIKNWSKGFKENNILCTSGKLITLFKNEMCLKEKTKINFISAWRISVLDFTK